MSLGTKIRSFLQSPKGRQMTDQGRQQLAKPENQAKLRRLMGKVRKGR